MAWEELEILMQLENQTELSITVALTKIEKRAATPCGLK